MNELVYLTKIVEDTRKPKQKRTHRVVLLIQWFKTQRAAINPLSAIVAEVHHFDQTRVDIGTFRFVPLSLELDLRRKK